jgi:hypothetical protein
MAHQLQDEQGLGEHRGTTLSGLRGGGKRGALSTLSDLIRWQPRMEPHGFSRRLSYLPTPASAISLPFISGDHNSLSSTDLAVAWICITQKAEFRGLLSHWQLGAREHVLSSSDSRSRDRDPLQRQEPWQRSRYQRHQRRLPINEARFTSSTSGECNATINTKGNSIVHNLQFIARRNASPTNDILIKYILKGT